MASFSFAEDADPIREQLSKAIMDNQTAKAKAKLILINEFDAKIKAVVSAGDLDGVQKITEEKKLFEADGTLPTSFQAKAYQKSIGDAEIKLDLAYKTAEIAYTKAGKLNEAIAIRKERAPKTTSIGITAAEWGVRTLDNKKWIPQPLNKMTVVIEGEISRIKNTTGIGSYAYVFNKTRLNGNFELSFKYMGDASFSLRPIDGQGSAIFTETKFNGSNWHTIEFTRDGTVSTMKLDGVSLPLKTIKANSNITNSNSTVGVFCIHLDSNSEVEIKDFKLTIK